MLSLPIQHPFTMTVLWEHRAIEVSLTVLPGYEVWDLRFIMNIFPSRQPSDSTDSTSPNSLTHPVLSISLVPSSSPLIWALAFTSTWCPCLHSLPSNSVCQSGVLCSADVSILFNSFWWLHIRINFTEHKLSALYCGRSLFVWQRFKIQATYILTLWSQASYLTPLCLDFLTA